MDWPLAAIICTGFVFLSPAAIVAITLRHREKMTALKHRQTHDPQLAEEVRTLRRELAAVRDKSVEFDLSFDAALARVEQRVDRLEAPVSVAPTPERSRWHVAEEAETQRVSVGGK